MEEKIVCVTGASRGIGAKICTRLALHGFTVIGLARSDDKVQNLGNNLEVGTKGKIIGWKCDVESETEIQDAFKQIKREFGKLDIFINNAGVMSSKFLIDDDCASFRKSFDVNVIASCVCLKEAVNLMKQTTGKGQIIVINSVLGHRIPDIPFPIKPTFGVYPATKHSLTALCQTLRQELNFLRLPIKVTSISPGMVETEMLNDMNQELIAMLPKLQDEDVADAVMFSINTPERVRIDEIVINPMLC